MLNVTNLIITEGAITRTEANLPDGYLPWADDLVKINMDSVVEADLDRFAHLNWRQLELKKDTYVRQLGKHTLFATECNQGWILELNHALDVGIDAYILSHTLGKYPILCPTLAIAAIIAEASCPAPKSPLYWLPYY